MTRISNRPSQPNDEMDFAPELTVADKCVAIVQRALAYIGQGK